MSWSLIITLFAILSVFSAKADDFQLIKNKMRESFLIEGPEKTEEISKWLTSQHEDGTWSDVNYEAVNSNNFAPIIHLERMAVMAQAFASTHHPFYSNAKIKSAVILAFNHWKKNDYQSYNWWNNEIGVPLRIVKAMFLLGKFLDKEQTAYGLEVLSRANKVLVKGTGQNLVWAAEIIASSALLQNNKDLFQSTINKMQNEITIKNAESIKADNSFFQHGQLVYSGGYGAKFSLDIARFIALVQGTTFSFDPNKIELYSRFVLDGQYWMTYANKFDYGVVGREITRKGVSAKILGQTCRIMSNLDVPRKNEFLNCAESISQNIPAKISGNKMFWLADFMSHYGNNFYTSVRMYSERTINNDAPSNGEGLLSHHLADGATFIMKDGSEYEDIFPVWDWKKIPGTTVEQSSLKPAQFVPGRYDLFEHLRYFGKSNFVGGVSDGKLGVASMDFVSNKAFEKVDARKSWFFFDKGFVALGNRINCWFCETVVTTLDQSLLKSKVSLVGRDGVITNTKNLKTNHFSSLKGVVHNNVAFIFPVTQKVNIKAGPQEGNWKRINNQLDNKLISKDVFSLWIDHGVNPISESYEYVVIPSMSPSELKSFDYSSEFEITNDVQKQVVFHKKSKVFQAVFFTDGSFENKYYSISVNEPCILMITRAKDNSLTLLVSDPTKELEQIHVTVNGKNVIIKLPRGDLAGKTVTYPL